MDVVPRLARSLFSCGGGRHPVVEVVLVLFEESGKQRELGRVVTTIGQIKATYVGH